MASLTAVSFVSLDGVVQGPGDPAEDTRGPFTHGGWLVPYVDADLQAAVTDIFACATAFLLGHRTYRLLAQQWQAVTDPHDVIARQLHTRPKFVASRATPSLSWANSYHLPDVVPAVRALKASLKGDIQVHGSADLLQTLLAHALVDDIRLLVAPVILGSGHRLFLQPPPHALRLVDRHTTRSGVLALHYQHTGPLQTGSLTHDDTP